MRRPGQDGFAGQGRRVHIIDDDDAVARSISRLLTLRGYETETYCSAEAFLDRLDSASHGCIITDMRLPGLTGLELARRLQRAACQMPVILCSGHIDEHIRRGAIESNVATVLQKPTLTHVLEDAINLALA